MLVVDFILATQSTVISNPYDSRVRNLPARLGKHTIFSRIRERLLLSSPSRRAWIVEVTNGMWLAPPEAVIYPVKNGGLPCY